MYFTGKPASMSSTHPNFPARFAVDGIPLSHSMAHSKEDGEYQPWLRVDLESLKCIWAVKLVNRYAGQWWI